MLQNKCCLLSPGLKLSLHPPREDHNILTLPSKGPTDNAPDWTNDRTPEDMQHPDIVAALAKGAGPEGAYSQGERPLAALPEDKKRSFKKRSTEPEWEVEEGLTMLGNRTQIPDQG